VTRARATATERLHKPTCHAQAEASPGILMASASDCVLHDGDPAGWTRIR
jgi:hypothetical protein